MVTNASTSRRLEPVSRYGSETALIDRASTGDPRAQRELVDRLRDRIHKTVFYLTGSERDVEEMTQAALIEILSSLKYFRGDASLSCWAERIAVRVALKMVRKRRLRDARHAPLQETADLFCDQARETERCRLQHRLSEALEKVDAKCRVALVLHHIQGYTVGEVARITKVRVNTVRGRLRSGREKLRRQILADDALKEWVQYGFTV